MMKAGSETESYYVGWERGCGVGMERTGRAQLQPFQCVVGQELQ